ncbi:hypothetical protein MBLNU230_g1345t1 [Neophaeotheca triangularis]
MAANEISRFSRRVVQYLWDPPPRNEDASEIWCLGRSYDSKYQPRDISKSTGTSPTQSDSAASDISKADSAFAPEASHRTDKNVAKLEDGSSSETQTEVTADEAELLGWPLEFLDDLESRTWLTYRSNFHAIPMSQDPAATAAMSFSTRMRNFSNQNGFKNDTNWGCMIRSGQAMLANTLSILRLGRDWRLGQDMDTHKEILSLFADVPEAPFSIQKFVEHGAKACGKHPGEWFGPSAAARCIEALTALHPEAGLNVYVRPNDSDVYTSTLLSTATTTHTTPFKPTLILLGVRLGIDRITPVYHSTLKTLLELPQSVGIAGGRPSSSHYFLGHQGDHLFYLDPHTTQPTLPAEVSDEDVKTCHTRRVRRLGVQDLDPSMLLGFLVRSEEDLRSWRAVLEGLPGKAVVHFHEKEAGYEVGSERPGAVDEVETWGESEDEGGL